jgi:hypothetical protein
MLLLETAPVNRQVSYRGEGPDPLERIAAPTTDCRASSWQHDRDGGFCPAIPRR